jgi:hypothetical protein
MIYGIWLALLGVLGAANLIISRRPDAKEAIGKIAPYQGWIGAGSAIWGAWGLISCVLAIGWMTSAPIYWFTWVADSAIQLVLGFLLGVGTLKTFIKDPKANEKMDQTIAKLSPYQGTLGLVAIGLGVWMIVVSIMWHV